METLNTALFLLKFFLFIWILCAVLYWFVIPDLKLHIKAVRDGFQTHRKGLLKVAFFLLHAHLIYPVRSMLISVITLVTLIFLGQ